MSNKASFLEASWQNLCLISYAVEPELLAKYMPEGLVADSLDGQAFVSLVAFDFMNTSVLGIKWPGHINFPEINLRFYVRKGEDRGVVFLQELVSKFIVAQLARIIYNEPYRTCPLESSVRKENGKIEIEHRLKVAGNKYRIAVCAHDQTFLPAIDSKEHFFKEQRWGFGKNHSGKTTRYEVIHPHWRCYPVISHELDFDFRKIYGDDFAFLTNTAPYSVIVAEGSQISVFPKE